MFTLRMQAYLLDHEVEFDILSDALAAYAAEENHGDVTLTLYNREGYVLKTNGS